MRALILISYLASNICHGFSVITASSKLPDACRYRSHNLHSFSMVDSAGKSKPRVVIVGATGYIGKYVVQESVRQGYETIAVCRPGSTPKVDYFKGAEVVYGDVTNSDSLKQNVFQKKDVDIVISCLASRSGVKSDSYAIDYQATLNALNTARANGAKHFILLSAFCVRRPLLQFQHAKLKFEEALTSAGDIK